jgi:hypothetical protein
LRQYLDVVTRLGKIFGRTAITVADACGYYRRLILRHWPDSREIMRALILVTSLGLALGTLTSSAGQELCRNALVARDTLREAPAVAAAVDVFYAKAGKGCAWSRDNAEALAKVIDATPDHGLDSALFNAARIDAIIIF